jgi:hypothetical protein
MYPIHLQIPEDLGEMIDTWPDSLSQQPGFGQRSRLLNFQRENELCGS